MHVSGLFSSQAMQLPKQFEIGSIDCATNINKPSEASRNKNLNII
jgi:hypothetical protein